MFSAGCAINIRILRRYIVMPILISFDAFQAAYQGTRFDKYENSTVKGGYPFLFNIGPAPIQGKNDHPQPGDGEMQH